MDDYGTYAHFNSFPIQTSTEKKCRRSACIAPVRKIQYLHEDYLMRQLWCNFPVLALSHSGERAVSLKKGQSSGVAIIDHSDILVLGSN